jgi:glycerol kinase
MTFYNFFNKTFTKVKYMEKYILSIDQSTSGTKAILFDKGGAVYCRHDLPHRQLIDENGWVEHDPVEIYGNLINAVKTVISKAGIDSGQIIGAGISNQRETAIVWDKSTGEPLYNAIVWQCARGQGICDKIAAEGLSEKVRAATGIPLSPYYSAAKIAWVTQNILKGASLENVCCSTMDSWLVYKLCGGEPQTDYSNASRTQLLNINTLRWDEEVCGLFGLTPVMLPRVCDSNSLYGYSDFEGALKSRVPIHGVLGDSHGALYGQGCVNPGMVKATYGTGSSVMMNIGDKPKLSDKGIVTSLAWSVNGKVDYVFEGNINYTGAVIRWLVDDLGLISSSAEACELAYSARQSDGLYIVPAFSGLGAPYWKGDAKGIICGLTRNSGKAEIVRAAEECIAYQIKDILELMRSEVDMKITELRADGGPANDSFLMQFQADIIDACVKVPAFEELSGSGPAYLAGIELGLFDRETVTAKAHSRIYTPVMSAERREKLYNGWKDAVKLVLLS